MGFSFTFCQEFERFCTEFSIAKQLLWSAVPVSMTLSDSAPNLIEGVFWRTIRSACKERTQGDVGRHVAERSLWRFVNTIVTLKMPDRYVSLFA